MPNQKAPARPARRSAEPASESAALAALRTTPSAPYRLKADVVERALLTGEHADLLKRYFGTEGYAEMRELAQSASARSVRGGPRVLILPGIMGSTLGSPRKWLTDDVIWLDPMDIARGKLKELALLPGPARHQAVGVVLVAYLKLKLRLRLADNYHEWDCCYPGLEVLPDGTIVTTTYGHWTAGEMPYILSVRLKLGEFTSLNRRQ